MADFVSSKKLIEIGTRVKDADGFRATVRYIGPVASAKNKTEEWLGVEWDKQERGKHDGSVVDKEGNFFKYFDCPNSSGSFVKSSKISIGRSFAEALTERYVKHDAPIISPDEIIPDAFVMTSKGHAKPIGFVGEVKIRRWQQINTIDKIAMRDDTVSSAGSDISNIASHLIEVDLQDNLLWEWSEISNLTVQMPGLRTLLLHGNMMQPLTTSITLSLPTGCFKGLRVLALNNCCIKSWSMIQLLEPFLPSIEELFLACNKLDDLPKASIEAEYEAATGLKSTQEEYITGFLNLRLLDVSSCGLNEWSQCLSFGNLSNLQDLLLDGNPLPSITVCPYGLFTSLQRLSCSSSCLNSWSDVNNISTYLSVRQLRLSHIPLFKSRGASEVRPLVIARIKELCFFNGSGIGPRERADSEKSYLRCAIREFDAAKDDSEKLIDFNILNPRFTILKEKYAAELLPMGINAAGGNIASDLLKITFKNMSISSGGRLEPLEKKLPGSLQISRLKLLVKQLFGLDAHLQQLSVRNNKDSMPVLLDDDQATLSYYGTIDDADIFINEAKA